MHGVVAERSGSYDAAEGADDAGVNMAGVSPGGACVVVRVRSVPAMSERPVASASAVAGGCFA